MQLKNCIKCSIAHILCSNVEKRCNFNQRRTKNRHPFALKRPVILAIYASKGIPWPDDGVSCRLPTAKTHLYPDQRLRAPSSLCAFRRTGATLLQASDA